MSENSIKNKRRCDRELKSVCEELKIYNNNSNNSFAQFMESKKQLEYKLKKLSSIHMPVYQNKGFTISNIVTNRRNEYLKDLKKCKENIEEIENKIKHYECKIAECTDSLTKQNEIYDEIQERINELKDEKKKLKTN